MGQVGVRIDGICIGNEAEAKCLTRIFKATLRKNFDLECWVIYVDEIRDMAKLEQFMKSKLVSKREGFYQSRIGGQWRTYRHLVFVS